MSQVDPWEKAADCERHCFVFICLGGDFRRLKTKRKAGDRFWSLGACMNSISRRFVAQMLA
jgi:hypothetical protein